MRFITFLAASAALEIINIRINSADWAVLLELKGAPAAGCQADIASSDANGAICIGVKFSISGRNVFTALLLALVGHEFD